MIISILVIIGSFLYCFFCFRSMIQGIIDYLMNKNAIKKRKKGSSFKDWLLFKKFRTEIPKYHIVMYYVSGLVYATILLIMIIFHIVNVDVDFKKIRVYIVISTIIFCALYEIIFFGFHTTYTFIYRKDKINILGIDKKKYRERIRKIKKLDDSSLETQGDDSSVSPKDD